MLEHLPGRVVDNATSVREEAAPYLELTPDARAELLVQARRMAMSITRARDDAERVLDWRDDVPSSTHTALRRLRATLRDR